MTRNPELVIALKDIGKSYQLFRNPREVAIFALGLNKLPFLGRATSEIPTFDALKNINLEVSRGDRIGVIGRNGAGKSTLLKIATGAILPTTGRRRVKGEIEALFESSGSFHPELSGYDNIVGALGMKLGHDTAKLNKAIEDVIDFVELGDFLGQPIKKYSKGMMARLGFAVATAVQPDIVIIDEVLGAGDSYFSAKSAARMNHMLGGECTLLLVSHATRQIMRFCERAIWIERGEVAMEGDVLTVVKAYEEFIERLSHEAKIGNIKGAAAQTLTDTDFRRDIVKKTLDAVELRLITERTRAAGAQMPSAARSEEPKGGPNTAKETAVAAVEAPSMEAAPKNADEEAEMAADVQTNIPIQDGVSRWPHKQPGLRVRRVFMKNLDDSEAQTVATGSPFKIDIDYEIVESGEFLCRFVVLFFTEDGRWLSRHISEPETLDSGDGPTRRKSLIFHSNYFGAGKVIFTVAAYKSQEMIVAGDSYETLSQSFAFKVNNPDYTDTSLLSYPGEWKASELIDARS